MKLAKSLLLGSAAAFAATAGAYAADLPYKKAAPVEYVRVCDWTGAGYFYIPGTDSCLKIGGFARLDFQIQNNAKLFIATPAATPAAGGSFFTGRHRDITGYDARGKIEVDVRTQTAYGTLRTFVRFQSDRLSGSEAGNGAPGVAGNVSSTYLDKGYIQFAGITAGRVQSFFDMDFGADPVGFEGVATTDESAEVLAYTATFGGGLSATVSVENPNVRRDGFQNTLTPGVGATSVGYGGDAIPDVVGNLLLVQPWGEAQLSAAYHEVNTTNTAITTVGGKTSEGYAVRAGFVVNLPMLAAGDKFELEGGYSKGAMQYTDSNGLNTGYTSYDLGGFLHPNVDAVALAVPGGSYKLALEQGYSVSGYLQHWLTPHFNDIVFGSYEHQGYGSGAGHLQWYQGGLGSASEYRIANQFNWVPVKDLSIGIEVMYAKLDQNIPGSVTLPKGVIKNPDGVQGRLRLERDF